MDTKALLTTRQVAERLDTTTSTVNRWVKSERIEPAVKGPGMTGAHLFDEAEVERFEGERGA